MVVLYSTKCPQCLALEHKLKENGIEFKEENSIDVMIEKGFMAAPMLEVDGEVMNYAESIQWINKKGK
jgi:glutaredoxin